MNALVLILSECSILKLVTDVVKLTHVCYFFMFLPQKKWWLIEIVMSCRLNY